MIGASDRAKYDEGWAAFGRRDYASAVRVFGALARRYPGEPDVAEMLGRSLTELGRLDEGEALIRGVVGSHPDRLSGRRALALVFRAREDLASAEAELDAALGIDPDDAPTIAARAELETFGGRYEEALSRLAPLIRGGRREPELVRAYAHAAERTDDLDEPIELLGSVIADHSTSVPVRVSLLYRRASLYEKAGRFDEAFADAKRANAGAGVRFDAPAQQRIVELCLERWTPDAFARLDSSGSDDESMVFVIGMPRSGTSLTEQILGRHPDVTAGGERPTVRESIRTLGLMPQPTPRLPSVKQSRELADRVLADRRSIGTDARLVTDKMPTNYLFLPYIAKALPRARFVHCRRHPLDVCLSCFMMGFTPPIDWATSLKSAGAFHSMYAALTERWASLPGVRMHEVEYESLVREPEGEVRRLLDFLDLPFDEACLSPERSDRVVFTPSVHQVRRPIYSTSIGRHERFEGHLGPLRAALGLPPR